jgi:hypothetical protein
MLRIIRGAGKPHAFLEHLSDAVAAGVKVRNLTGQLPTDILQSVLHRESETEAIWEKRRAGKIDETSIERWIEDGTFGGQDAEDQHNGWRVADHSLAVRRTANSKVRRRIRNA